MKKYATRILLVMALSLLAITPIHAESIDLTDLISTPNEANQRVQFHYYVPDSVLNSQKSAHPVLVCMPSLGSSGWKFITDPIREFAETEGFILLAPTFRFDARDHNNGASYIFPAAWSGEALLQMVNKIEKNHDVSISTYYFFGFSAGAGYSIRFGLWKPELTTAVSAHGSSAMQLPTRKVPVDFFISSGSGDTRALAVSKEFAKTGDKLGIKVTFEEYEGGHWLPEEKTLDTLEHFRKIHHSNREVVFINSGLLISAAIFFGGLLMLHLATNLKPIVRKKEESS